MKKIFLVLILAISFGTVALAQEDMPPQSGEGQGGQGGMKKGKMMGMMNQDQMIATSDGGVVLKQGPRLLKYDASLTLVNEVEIPRPKKNESKSEISEPSPEEMAVR